MRGVADCVYGAVTLLGRAEALLLACALLAVALDWQGGRHRAIPLQSRPLAAITNRSSSRPGSCAPPAARAPRPRAARRPWMASPHFMARPRRAAAARSALRQDEDEEAQLREALGEEGEEEEEAAPRRGRRAGKGERCCAGACSAACRRRCCRRPVAFQSRRPWSPLRAAAPVDEDEEDYDPEADEDAAEEQRQHEQRQQEQLASGRRRGRYGAQRGTCCSGATSVALAWVLPLHAYVRMRARYAAVAAAATCPA